MFRATFFALALAFAANPALADEVTDTLSSALEAYSDGDIDYALEELDYAKQLLQEMSTQELARYLPEAPSGWSREIIESDMSAGLALMGGGSSAAAKYSNGTDEVELTFIADSPMVTMFAGMLSNAGMLGMKLYRVGRQKFVEDDGDLSGLVDNRILVQAKGAAPEAMIPLLEAIDYRALKDFGN